MNKWNAWVLLACVSAGGRRMLRRERAAYFAEMQARYPLLQGVTFAQFERVVRHPTLEVI